MSDEQREDIIRVLRIVEYVGARSIVEKQVANSIHGEKVFTRSASGQLRIPCTIRATTLGTFPEILESAVLIQALKGEPTEKDLKIAELEKELHEERGKAASSPWPQNSYGAQLGQLGSAAQAGPVWLQGAYGAPLLTPRDAQDLQQQINAAIAPSPTQTQALPTIDKIKSRFGL